MKVRLLPYTKIDGVRTFSDSFVMNLWDRMQGYSPYMDRIYTSRDHWLRDMQTYSLLYVIEVDGETAGCTWLTHFQEKFAQVHFFYFPEWWGRTQEIGTEAMRQSLSWKNEQGYVFDGFTGIVDKKNRLAIALAKRCGWREAGEIPFAFGQEKPGVMMYITRNGG